MNNSSWNGTIVGAGRPWNGFSCGPYQEESPPSSPPTQRFRKSTRYAGIHNATVRRESAYVAYEARTFFEYNGISGLNTIDRDDVRCPGFKLGKDAV